MPEMAKLHSKQSMQITKNQPESIALHTAERYEDIPESEHTFDIIVKNDFEKISHFIQRHCFRKAAWMEYSSISSTLDTATMPAITTYELR